MSASPRLVRSALFVGSLLCLAAFVGQDATASPRPAGTSVADGARGHLSKRVAIRGGRKLYIECRGRGRPTVVLEAGSGNTGAIWRETPDGPGRAVFPAVAKFTRVCLYDRPGTYLLSPRRLSRSTPVAMPRSARDIVIDLRSLLRAARVPGPYILAGHSFGGMTQRLSATSYPRRIAGLVSVDAQTERFAAAYRKFLSPAQFLAAVLEPQAPPQLEDYPAFERLDLEVSAAQMQQAQTDTPLKRMPLTVISHSRQLANPFGFPAGWPIAQLDRAFQRSQDKLARLVPHARHVTAKKSGHYIQLDQPGLVTREIGRMVKLLRRR
jgi:pimeloyl-ACP methyl ester carboxylesterase